MKKYLIILFLLFTISANAENTVCTPDVCPDDGKPATYELALSTAIQAVVSSSAAPAAVCAGANQYIGNHDHRSASPVVVSGYTVWNGSVTFTTPAGVTNVCSLGAYAIWVAGGGNILVALYSEDGATLICQGNAQKATADSYADIEWTYGASELTGTCTVSGSTNYKIVVTGDGTGVRVGATAGDSGVCKYDAQDKTAGFAGYTLPAGTNHTTDASIWVGVQ